MIARLEQSMMLAMCGDDGVHLDDTAMPGQGIVTTVDVVQRHPAGIGNLAEIIEPDGILEVDPFQRLARDICP